MWTPLNTRLKRCFHYLLVIGLSILSQNIKSQDLIAGKVDSLLQKMTLEEKVGQMNQYNGFWNATGPAPTEGQAKDKYEDLRQGRVGSVLNIQGAVETRKMQELVMSQSRMGIPLIFGMDVIHGYKTISPIPLAEAASWDMTAIEKSARIAAMEASSAGIHWTFAPMVDISRDARWGRVMEGAGEDPYLGSQIAKARVRGIQGADLADPTTMAACAKHFAGYGFSESGRDYNTVDIGTYTLHNVVLPPFKACVDAGAATFMNSFNVLNGVPATANSFLMRDILKGKWGYKGVVVSDWSSGREMIAHGFAKDEKDVARLATNAGSDMDMESYANIAYLTELVNEGRVKMSDIDDAVRRILRLKFDLGLFDDPYRYSDVIREQSTLKRPEFRQEMRAMAQKSIVLLKNEKGLLPLNQNQTKIALIGQLASDKNSPLGNWRGAGEDHSAVSVLEGLGKYTGNVTFAQGPKVFTGNLSFINEVQINVTDKTGIDGAVALAAKSEVVIMVLGEHGYQTGEGRSRTMLDLPGLQDELLQAVYEVNPNIILVLMNGRPLVLNWADENIPAILEAWHLGTESGNAIADVIFGAHNPSGKLPMTFPRSVGQVPIYYNHFNTGRPGPMPLVFWSHYADEQNSPLYPFGYGLSYTSFEYTDLNVDASDSDAIKVKLKLKNTGRLAGEEVVQLYIRDRVASYVRPVKELKAFQKRLLQVGETQEIQFVLTKKDLGFYDAAGNFIIEPGEFDIMVGTNSNEGITASFELR